MSKLESDICIMDLEVITSDQLDYDGFPVEIGWNDVKTGELITLMIKPSLVSEKSLPVFKIQDFFDFQDFTSLTLEELEEHGVSPRAAANRLNYLLNSQIVYFDMGIRSDTIWLDNLFKEAKVDMEFTVKPLQNLINKQFGYLASQRFGNQHFEISEAVEHRAAADVIRIHQMYLEIEETFDKVMPKSNNIDLYSP